MADKPNEVEIGGQAYPMREPTIEAVQSVAEFANSRIADLLKGRKLDESMELKNALTSILTEGGMFSKYLTSMQMNEPIMTVMLATGCTPDTAVKASMTALKTCREYLGGGASDFLLSYGIDIRIKQAAGPEATQTKSP